MKKTYSILLLNLFIATAAVKVTAQANNFAWAKRMGATFDDSGYSITTDASGNVYTTGYFEGTVDFDPSMAGTFNLTSNGLGDIFIQKLSAAGNFLWAKQMGGGSYDYGYGIALDANGNIFTTGSFDGTVDFDPGSGVFNLTSAGGHDIFIQKLDPSGNFVWAKSFGGTNEEEGLSVTTDAGGNVFATGYFGATVDFDPGAATFNLTANGQYDIFILKLDASGNFAWADAEGAANYDYGKAITADAAGNVYITGTFGGAVDFDPGTGTEILTSNGGSFYGDIFVQKLDGAGNLLWVRQMGGLGDDIGTSIATDAAGNIYTTGWFQATVDFDPGLSIFNITTTGTTYTDDIFVQKLDASGNFVWANHMGGISDDRGFSLTVDPNGSVCVTGYHADTGDFDPGSGTFNLTGSGTFIQKTNSGGAFEWAKHISISEGHAIASDASGNLYTTGQFDHTVDFDPGTASFNLMSAGGSIDIFILKLSYVASGIFENTLNDALVLYPDPSEGQFVIDFGKFISVAEIRITDIAGKLLYYDKINNVSRALINLEQPAGFYFVSITSETQTKTLKLVKE